MQKAGGVGRVQDCSDVNVTLGAGVDGYSITYDHASGKFVLSSVSGVGISKIQDADDVNFSLGAGVDGYTVNYDHDTGKFVLTAPVVPDPPGIGANGSRATIGFLGSTPSAQLAHVADVKGDYAAGDLDSEAEVISMANAFAAAINSLNALVETFGLRASS